MLIADRIVRPAYTFCWTNLALLAGTMVLAYEPLLWLTGTWYSAGYEGVGWIACLLVLGLALWSGSSLITTQAPDVGRTYGLLLGTAVIRLLSQLLDVNVVGALLLAVDVYALATLCHLPLRQRAVSAFWLAGLFCFSLPIEPIVQRLLGYGMQQLSADIACTLLGPFYDDLVCSGVRLQIAGRDVMVDLPCSGAQLLSTALLVTCLINSLVRPAFRWGAASVVVSLSSALLFNAVRVALLAAGIAHQEILGFSVMAPLPHTLLGVFVVALTSGVVVVFARLCPVTEQQCTRQSCFTRLLTRRPAVFALLFLVFALSIGAIQPQPVDKSPSLPPPEMPRVAAGFLRNSAPLSTLENSYFTRYGGSAARASYGPFGLLLVSTASPLRHLHDPTICLRAMGYDVQLQGVDHAQGATVYRAVANDLQSNDAVRKSQSYIVNVTYRSASGQQALSIAEVIWHWARNPRETWTMVQRIVPEDAAITAGQVAEFEAVISRSMSLQPANSVTL
ncbi:MAG: exosortase T [Pseudomonadaceae bacterium]|nr:exosortase T [Pseudomonadaceae bacterium]